MGFCSLSAKVYLGLGIAFAIITLVLIPISIFVPVVIQKQFESTLLRNIMITEWASKQDDHSVYQSWKDSTEKGATPTKLNAYFFNITNSEDVLLGKAPTVEEIGPYVYTIVKKKDRIKFTTDVFGEKIVEYVEWKQYEFDADATDPQYKESDVISNTNLIFQLNRALGSDNAYKLYGSAEWNDYTRQFVSKTIKEWLFGWEDEQYTISPKHFFGGLLGPVVASPEDITTPHSMYTGETRIGNAFQYNMHSGTKSFVPSLLLKSAPMWANFDSSRLVGTDGTRFSPHLNKSNPIHTFVDEAKRSIPLKYQKEYQLQGLTLYEYRIGEETLQNATTNPANEQWSMYTTGIFNLAPQKLMPMILSKPHFLGCDDSLSTKIDGLHPSIDKHDTILGVHELSGIVMEASKSLQISVNTLGPLDITSTGAQWFPTMAENTFQPIAWLSERGRIKDEDANKLQGKISSVSFIVSLLTIGTSIICCILLLITAWFLYMAYRLKVAEVTVINSGAYGDYNAIQ